MLNNVNVVVNENPSELFFATGSKVNNNDFIGLGIRGSVFVKNTIIAPKDCELTSVTFSIRNTVPNSNITAEVWVNNALTLLSANIEDGNTTILSTGTGSVFVLQGDLISLKMQWNSGGNLPNGITASIAYR